MDKPYSIELGEYQFLELSSLADETGIAVDVLANAFISIEVQKCRLFPSLVDALAKDLSGHPNA